MIIKKIKILLIIIFILNIYSLDVLAKQEAKILFRINNEIITNLDIKKEAQYLIALNNELMSMEKNKILELSKNSLIREKIKIIELKKNYDLNRENKKIELILTNFYKKLNFNNVSEFKNYLSNYGITYGEVKNKIKIESMWNSLIYTRFNDQVVIDLKKLKKKIKTEYSNEEEVYLLSEILFSIKNVNEFDEKYKLIKESITKTGFKNTANIYSVSDSSKLGGKIGWIKKSQLSNVIKNEIEKINMGEVSRPIKIVNGYIILKLEDKKIEKKEVNFDKKLKELINYERNKQLNQFSILYFNKIKINQTIK